MNLNEDIKKLCKCPNLWQQAFMGVFDHHGEKKPQSSLESNCGMSPLELFNQVHVSQCVMVHFLHNSLTSNALRWAPTFLITSPSLPLWDFTVLSFPSLSLLLKLVRNVSGSRLLLLNSRHIIELLQSLSLHYTVFGILSWCWLHVTS